MCEDARENYFGKRTDLDKNRSFGRIPSYGRPIMDTQNGNFSK